MQHSKLGAKRRTRRRPPRRDHVRAISAHARCCARLPLPRGTQRRGVRLCMSTRMCTCMCVFVPVYVRMCARACARACACACALRVHCACAACACATEAEASGTASNSEKTSSRDAPNSRRTERRTWARPSAGRSSWVITAGPRWVGRRGGRRAQRACMRRVHTATGRLCCAAALALRCKGHAPGTRLQLRQLARPLRRDDVGPAAHVLAKLVRVRVRVGVRVGGWGRVGVNPA